MTTSDEKMIAFCGLICTECPAFIATKEYNPEKIAAVAEMWSKEYGMNVTPDTVWCDGCLVDGRKCGHCQACAVRACGKEKGVPNCGLCPEFSSCVKLAEIHKLAPHAKKVLEKINSHS